MRLILSRPVPGCTPGAVKASYNNFIWKFIQMFAFTCRHPVNVLRKFTQSTRLATYTVGDVWREYRGFMKETRLPLANGNAYVKDLANF